MFHGAAAVVKCWGTLVNSRINVLMLPLSQFINDDFIPIYVSQTPGAAQTTAVAPDFQETSLMAFPKAKSLLQ
jgi:hypothetical protein